MARPVAKRPAGRCKCRVETYSRVVGYYRPVQQWNEGKKSEFADRVTFDVSGRQAEKGVNEMSQIQERRAMIQYILRRETERALTADEIASRFNKYKFKPVGSDAVLRDANKMSTAGAVVKTAVDVIEKGGKKNRVDAFRWAGVRPVFGRAKS